ARPTPPPLSPPSPAWRCAWTGGCASATSVPGRACSARRRPRSTRRRMRAGGAASRSPRPASRSWTPSSSAGPPPAPTPRGAAALTGAAPLGGSVGAAPHGGTAKHAIGVLLGWPESVSARLLGLGNCHWAELRGGADGGWLLRSYNVGASLGQPPRTERVAE